MNDSTKQLVSHFPQELEKYFAYFMKNDPAMKLELRSDND